MHELLRLVKPESSEARGSLSAVHPAAPRVFVRVQTWSGCHGTHGSEAGWLSTP